MHCRLPCICCMESKCRGTQFVADFIRHLTDLGCSSFALLSLPCFTHLYTYVCTLIAHRGKKKVRAFNFCSLKKPAKSFSQKFPDRSKYRITSGSGLLRKPNLGPNSAIIKGVTSLTKTDTLVTTAEITTLYTCISSHDSTVQTFQCIQYT